MPHWNSWHRGAEELSPLLDSLSIYMSEVIRTDGNLPMFGGSLNLEFLYPYKTLAFLKHLSQIGIISSPQFSPHHHRKTYCGRCYSTGTTSEGNEQSRHSVAVKTRYENLTSLLEGQEPGYYDEAWYHMQHELANADALLVNRLMVYLSTSKRGIDQVRVLGLGERLKISEFGSGASEALTQAFLYHKMIDDAYLFVCKLVEENSIKALKAVKGLIVFGIDNGLWTIAEQAFKLVPDSIIDDTKLLVPEDVVSEVQEYLNKYLAWVAAKPMDSYTPEFSVWLGTGVLAVLLSLKTSERAKEAVYVLKALHEQGWATGVGWPLWVGLMTQLHQFSLHRAAADVYLIYRNTPLKEYPTDCEISKLLYGTLISFGHLQDLRNIGLVFEDWLHFGSRPSEEACLYVMRQFASRGEILALKNFYEYYVSRFPVGIGVVSAMMHAHAVRGEIHDVLGWFQKLQNFKIPPDRYTYNILLNAYKRVGDIDSAIRRFFVMFHSKDELKPDLVTYQTLMSLCANRGDIEAVEHLLDMMKGQGIFPNQSIYNTVTYTYVNQRNPDKTRTASVIANEVFTTLKQGGRKWEKNHTYMWNNILVGYLWSQELPQIAATYEQMRGEKIPFDSYTYSILLHSLCLAGKTTEAEQVLDMLEKEKIMRLNQIHYATIMLDYMLRKDINKVWLIYNRMLQAGLSPTFITQAILIQVVSSAEYSEYRSLGGVLFLREAEAILAQTTSNLSVLDLQSPDNVKSAIPPFLFVPLMQVYAREGSHERTLELFQRFMVIQQRQSSGGTTPDLRMYLHVANSLLRSGNTKLLLDIWFEAKKTASRSAKRAIYRLSKTEKGDQKPILPNHGGSLCPLFSVVIRALALDRDPDKIAWERDQLIHQGFTLDNLNINDMVQGLIVSGRPLQAFALCEELLMPGYIDPLMLLTDRKYSRAPFYPFLRTLECLLAEGRSYLHVEGYKGMNQASRTRLAISFKRGTPKTWAAINELDDAEHKIMKEWLHQQSRLQWGRAPLEFFIWPTYDDTKDNTIFIKDLKEMIERDMAQKGRLCVPAEQLLVGQGHESEPGSMI